MASDSWGQGWVSGRHWPARRPGQQHPTWLPFSSQGLVAPVHRASLPGWPRLVSTWGPGVSATDHLLLWVQVAPAVCHQESLGGQPPPLCFNKVSLKSYVSHITGEDGALTTSAQMAEEDTSSQSLPFVPFQSLSSPKATSLPTLNIRDHFCLAWNFGSMTSHSATLGSGFTPLAFH